jgi:hypothetical protein
MTTQDLIEKIKAYPLPSAAGLVALVILLALYFRMDAMGEVEARLAQVTAESDSVSRNLRYGAGLDGDLARMQAYTNEFDSRLVRPAEMAKNLQHFYALENLSGVVFSDARQLSVPEPKKGEKPLFVPVGYSVTFSGDFVNVVKFLEQLETSPLLYRIRSFDLQRARNQRESGALVMSMNLEAIGTP